MRWCLPSFFHVEEVLLGERDKVTAEREEGRGRKEERERERERERESASERGCASERCLSSKQPLFVLSLSNQFVDCGGGGVLFVL